MRRLRMAVFLLVCVMAIGLCSSLFVSRTADLVLEPLDETYQLTLSGRLTDAAPSLHRAQKLYTQREAVLSMVVSEDLLNAVRAGFARADAALYSEQPALAADALAQLRQAAAELKKTESLSLGAFF